LIDKNIEYIYCLIQGFEFQYQQVVSIAVVFFIVVLTVEMPCRRWRFFVSKMKVLLTFDYYDVYEIFILSVCHKWKNWLWMIGFSQ